MSSTSPAAGGESSSASGRRPPRRRRGRKGQAEHVSGARRKNAEPNTSTGQSRTGNNDTSSSSSSLSSYRPHKVPLITLTEETPTWFECGRHTPGRDDTLATIIHESSPGNPSGHSHSGRSGHSGPVVRRRNRNPPDVVQRYRALGEKIYQHEVALSKQQHSAGSGPGSGGRDEAWVESTMRRGTLKDRVAAMSVVVSAHPVHKLYALDLLLSMVGIHVDRQSGQASATGPGRPNDRVAQLASEALQDLFANTLLPGHRKLVAMDGRPLYLYEAEAEADAEHAKHAKHAQRTLSPRVLLLWRYEEHLKTRYAAYVDLYLSRTLSETTLDLTKVTALRTASDLLTSLPEGESQLLALVANKLGDPSRRVAGAAGHRLRMVLERHPAMTAVVAREVQQLAHRPHLSSRALYSCIVFLNQLKLRREEDADDDGDGDGDDDGDGDIDSDNDSDGIDEDTGSTSSHNKGGAGARKKATSKKKKRKRKQQQSLPASLINTYFRLFEVAIKKSEAVAVRSSKAKGKAKGGNTAHDDGTMRGRLLSALLSGVNRAHPYLPRRDAAMEEHVDSLYRIAHTSPPAACTQALMLLYNLAVGTPPSEGSSNTSSDASGNGSKDKRKGASGASGHAGTNANIDAASARRDRFYRALYSKLSDPAMFSGRQITLFFNLVYKATKNDPDGARAVACAKRLLHTAFHSGPPVVTASLFLISEVMKFQPMLENAFEISSAGGFDPSKREPRAAFAAGDDAGSTTSSSALSSVDEPRCSLWEIALTAQHYHPTVQKFSSSLGQIKYTGDPLRDFSLVPFLDKLAYRNPKSRERLLKHLKRGESVAERRLGSGQSLGARASLPMNDPSLISDGRRPVGADEEFFRTFFLERAKRDEIKGISRDKSVQADGGDGSDAEFEAIDAAEMEGAKKALEEGWNTDSSEEEFAQKLAEKLMEDAGNGKANFDDEDPDMEGWSDLEASSDDEDEKNAEEDVGNDENIDYDYSAMDGIGEASLDSDDVISDDMDDEDDDADAFMDGDVSDNESDDDGMPRSSLDRGQYPDDDEGNSSDEDGFPSALIADEESDDDEDGNVISSDGGKKNTPKRENYLEGFADAADYQHLIGQGWEKRKRSRSQSFDQVDGHDDVKTSEVEAMEKSSTKNSRSQKRRKRRKGI